MVIQEHGCIKCGHIESSKKRKSEIKDIMVELTRLHGNKLSFDKIKDYKNTHDIISYYCNICKNKSSKDIKSLLHGEGCGCNRVGVDKRSAESMILEADNIHESKFKYIITPDGRNSKLEYICKECNKSTLTTWNEHLRGVGCLNCSPLGIRKHNIESILEREQQIFDNEIICTDSSFGGFDSNGHFKCSKCNKTYVQNWKCHLDGNGCPICKDNRGCLLYYVLVNHNGICYYKIGITRNSIRTRYRKK